MGEDERIRHARDASAVWGGCGDENRRGRPGRGRAERRAALRRVQHARRGAAQLLGVPVRRRLPRGGGGRPTGGAAIRLGGLFARRFAKGDARELGVKPSGACLLYTSPSPRDATLSRMPSSA